MKLKLAGCAFALGALFLPLTAAAFKLVRELGDFLNTQGWSIQGLLALGKPHLRKPGPMSELAFDSLLRWSVNQEWLNNNLKNHTGAGNLCIVTGFRDSMKGM
jgi:hypothetical protein